MSKQFETKWKQTPGILFRHWLHNIVGHSDAHTAARSPLPQASVLLALLEENSNSPLT